MLMGLMPNLYKTYFRLGIRFEARPVYDSCMFCLGHGVFCLSRDDVYIVLREGICTQNFPGANNHLITQTLNYISKCSKRSTSSNRRSMVATIISRLYQRTVTCDLLQTTSLLLHPVPQSPTLPIQKIPQTSFLPALNSIHQPPFPLSTLLSP